MLLESIDVRLSLDEVYQGINFDEPLVEDQASLSRMPSYSPIWMNFPDSVSQEVTLCVVLQKEPMVSAAFVCSYQMQ